MPAKKNPSSNLASRIGGAISLIPGGYVAWTGTAPLWVRIWLGAGVALWLLFTILAGLLASAAN